jgi:hypothetical protein
VTPFPRLVALLLAEVLLVAACGNGDGTGGGGGSETLDGAGENEVESELDDDGASSLSTELDLGAPFAEDPFATGTLGPMAVSVTSFRNPIETPSVSIDLTNSGDRTLGGVSFLGMFQVVGTSTATEQPLVLSAQSAEGDCALGDVSAEAATVSCDFGDVATGTAVGVDLVISGLPKLSIAMTLEARNE